MAGLQELIQKVANSQAGTPQGQQALAQLIQAQQAQMGGQMQTGQAAGPQQAQTPMSREAAIQKVQQLRQMIHIAAQEAGIDLSQIPSAGPVPSDPNAPSGNPGPSKESISKFLGKQGKTSDTALIGDEIDPSQIDKFNRENGLYTNFSRTGKSPITQGVGGNEEREQKRLEGDKRNRASDPFVNTALINNAREDARHNGQLFDEKEAKKQILAKLSAGDNDFSDISETVDDVATDKLLKKIAKVNKLDEALNIKPAERSAKLAKLRAETVKANKESGLFSSDRIPLPIASKNEHFKRIVALDKILEMTKQFENNFDADLYKAIPNIKTQYMGLAQRWGIKKLKSEEEAQVAKYGEFRRKMQALFNLYVKETTGATVRADEEPRIRRQILNGTMGPTQAAATIQGMIQEIQQTRARLFDNASYGLPAQPQIANQNNQALLRGEGAKPEIQEQLGGGESQRDRIKRLRMQRGQ